MAETALRLNNLSKVFINGKHKRAIKAQRAILNLQAKIINEIETDETGPVKTQVQKLHEAQNLFNQDKFTEAYRRITDRAMHVHGRDRGTVVHALTDVNLTIKKGELVAIMGPSGSGKSTLLNMLGLLDEPTSGLVFIHHHNATNIKAKELPNLRSADLGFVFQSFNLIPTLTAIENVMLPLRYAGIRSKDRRKLAAEALEKVGLSDRIHHTPNEMSGGQQQRVAIARSIVNNPSIILADELTGELDSKMTKEIMDLIIELNQKGQTFVIVTHNPEVAAYCQKTLYMLDGKIARIKIK
jgi:ABC-type lipoprotein export system ATPase subunit